MKKIMILLVLLCSMTFGQGWNSTVTTTIEVEYLDKIDLFTNKDGNHIVIERTDGYIIYYRINSEGTYQDYTTLTSSGEFPSITGTNDKLYVFYRSGTDIVTRYSTNGGSSWSTLTDISISSNACIGVDAEYEDQVGVHLVYALNDSGYKTYYYLLNTSHQWVN